MNRAIKINSLILLSYLAATFLLFHQRIGQDPAYHRFADSRFFFSIPNFQNVFSNILFLIFGSAGIFICCYSRKRRMSKEIFTANLFFFSGIFLTAIGSSYYHLQPTTETLLWDRLPMAISFMAFFSIILSEYVLTNHRNAALYQLLFLGLISVTYWYKTEQEGMGDLRLYAFVQFLPMLLLPLILILFRSEGRFSLYYWGIIIFYGLAKLCEYYDQEIFTLTRFISGHSLKHYLAACAPLIYLIKVSNELIFYDV